MSPKEVKESSFLEIIRMLDEFNDMNNIDKKDKEEKLPVGTVEY